MADSLQTTILPPDHPSVEDAAEDAACPVTKAVKKHHKGKVVEHVSSASARNSI